MKPALSDEPGQPTTRLRVAVDLRIVDAPGMEVTGLGRYALEVVHALFAARPYWQLVVPSNRSELLDPPLRRAAHKTRFPTSFSAGRVAWLHSASALVLREGRPDVWFSPSFITPLWWRGPSVVTVHDLSFLMERRRYKGLVNSWYATSATRLSVRRADRVVCDSAATAGDVERLLGIPRERLVVIPLGVSERFRGVSSTEHGDARKPYLLFVGRFEAKKGLEVLEEAFDEVAARHPNISLVLAGQPGWGTESVVARLQRRPQVEIITAPSDERLAQLYREATLLVHPSRMEGFGLPVAEALASGCAVVASDLPSIREFAGDAAVYVPVGNARALAATICSLLERPDELARRRAAAPKAVRALGWQAAGRALAEVIETAAQRNATTGSARGSPSH
jgi:glycosyltransferase involved in cell wall biosynthesis